MMRDSITDEFVRRLKDAERTFDVRPLCALFASDATLINLTRHNTPSQHDHVETAAHFWRQYLAAFQSVSSRFTHVLEHRGAACLEWHSKGVLPMGIPLEYCGVTIIEHNGSAIHRLRTYYDSAALLPHAQRTAKSHSESVGTPELTIGASS